MKDDNKYSLKTPVFNNLGIENSMLLEAVNDAVILMQGTKFVDCNLKAANVFGFKSKKELINRKPYELSPEFQISGHPSEVLAREKIDSALGGEPQFFEWTHKKADGKIFFAEISLNRINWNEQKLLIALVRDISKRKKLESINKVLFNISSASVSTASLEELLHLIRKEVNTLMDARNFYVALVRNLKHSLYTIPFIVDENPEELVSPDEELDLKNGFTDFVAKSGYPLLANHDIYKEMLANGIELIGTNAKSWLGVPLKAPGGRIIGVVVIQSYSDPDAYSASDKKVLATISNTIASAILHKRAEASIKYSEQRFRRLSDAADEGIVFLGRKNIILDSNRAFLKLTGYKLGELSGMSLESMIEPDSLELFKNKSRKMTVKPIELKLKVKKGNYLDCIFSVRYFSRDKKSIRVASFRDISVLKKIEMEKKELSERLMRSEKMEAVGQLAGGVAHELNNVLTGIVNYPDVILMNLDDRDFVRKSIKRIKESGLKAAAIVEDLLALARRGLSKTEIFNLNLITKDFLKSPEFEKISGFFPGIKFETDLDKNLKNMKGSWVHLNSTLMNLVKNAAESIKNKGKVIIKSRNIKSSGKLFGKKGEDYILLSVADTGAGISEKEKIKIFEPFYSKKILGRKGTGLGMSVVWGTVKDHMGFINIKSTKKKGSEFELFFPVSELPMPDTLHGNEEKIPEGRGEKILIVDDEEYIRDIAGYYLKRMNYDVRMVASGEAAVNAFKKEKYDIFLLDMIMPSGYDGLETFLELSKIDPSVKAVIVSGYSETKRVKMALESGRCHFLKKPFTFQRIVDTVGKALDNKI